MKRIRYGKHTVMYFTIHNPLVGVRRMTRHVCYSKAKGYGLRVWRIAIRIGRVAYCVEYITSV